MLPPYVVASKMRKVVHRPLGRDPSSARPSWLPVGVRHAIPSGPDAEITTRRALCGAPLTDWFIFATVAFTGHEGADCQRCEHLMRLRRSARAASEKAAPHDA